MIDTATTEAGSEKHLKEVPVVQDQGYFKHETEDTYDGSFEAKKKDRSAKMHGIGVYTTAEGDTYSGHWDSDRLGVTEEVVITFADGSKYEGPLKDWCYSNGGKYTYPDGSLLQGDFADNCPIGQLTLIDPNEHIWLGKAEQGFGWFEPVNHFYEHLEKTRDQNRKKRVKPAPEDSPSKHDMLKNKSMKPSKASKLSQLSKTSKQSQTSNASKLKIK